MRKLVKLCLAVAMVGAMAAPVMADSNVAVSGQAFGAFKMSSSLNGSEKDTKRNTMDYDADIQVKVTNKSDSLETGAVAVYNYNNDFGAGKKDVYVFIGNEDMMFRIGNIYAGGVTKGLNTDWGWMGAYADQYKFGEGGNGADFMRINQAEFALKKVGLKVALGMWSESDSGFGVQQSGLTYGGASGDVDVTMFRAKFEQKFGAIDLAASYQSITKSANKEAGASTASNGGSKDGFTEGDLAVGVGIGLGEKMTVGVNFESISSKSNSKAKELSDTYLMAAFDMNLGGKSVNVSYGLKSDEVTDGNTQDVSNLNMTYNQWVGGAAAYVNYNMVSASKNTKANAGKIENSELAIGMLHFF